MTRPGITISFAVLLTLAFFCLSSSDFVPRAIADRDPYGLPTDIDRSARYLFFLHNYYVEVNGPQGDCKYYDILKAFAEKGFVVVSEIRSGPIIPCTYAQKVVTQIKMLLDSGVPPQHITVCGHSKGAVIGLCIASELDDPKVNFVILAGCEIAAVKKFKLYPDFKKLHGRMLSVYANSDSVANSCREAFSAASGGFSATEIKLESDAGHQLFFTPQEIWLDPVIRWINP